VFKPITLIVVTLAVVGSVVEYLDPAYAASPNPTVQAVPVSEAKLKQLEGLFDKTHTKDIVSKREEVVSRKRNNTTPYNVKSSSPENTVTIDIVLGSAKKNKMYARWYIKSKEGWGGDQFSCLDSLWTHESSWSHTATNGSSGAYGIPQSLPADKMASAGSDWKTNPATQIHWGTTYIKSRYGNPCSAYSHFKNKGWY
jgi:hypothetical protein